MSVPDLAPDDDDEYKRYHSIFEKIISDIFIYLWSYFDKFMI